MTSSSPVAAAAAPTAHGQRILPGRDGWWFLGPGGSVARLKAGHLSAQGTLLPKAEQHLRDQGMFRTQTLRTYALTVLTSTDCNLGCGYCFQNTAQDPTGGTRPARIAHARLTPDTIDDILEFTARRMAQVEIDRLSVLLFGGEPLLNPRGCVELLARADRYGLTSARMISNATLLTPQLAKELSDLKLRSVQVTFDGDRPDHDRIRARRAGGGTFDAITRNIARADEATPLTWNLRVNVSHHNLAGIDALIERLAERLTPQRCSIGFTRVGDIGVGYGNELLHGGGLAASFARWHRSALDHGFSVQRPRAAKTCQTCSHPEGRYGAVVNADGTLASCWETAGRPEWRVGSAREGYLPAEQTEGRWVSCEQSYQYPDDERAMAAFQDEVDAALLDDLSATGRL
jgi:uncharacterized protein